MVKDCKNVTTVMGEVHDIDVEARQVRLRDQAPLPYDTVVVAAGVGQSYFGNDAWATVAPGLKTIEHAIDIRARVLMAFEQAELATDPAEREAWLRFVVVGGGPTGVELAGALGELAEHTMAGEFRRISSEDARIVLIEGGPRILAMYVPRMSEHAVAALHDVGVAVLCQTKVVGIDSSGVDIETKEGPERIAAKTVLWAAGIQASPLGKVLANRAGAALDRAGRVVVEADLTVAGHPEILVLGDLAHYAHTPDRQPLPGVAPVAMQMGKHAVSVIAARVLHPDLAAGAGPTFSYLDKGTMAVIGRNQAVARVGFGLNVSFGGFPAWLAWLFIHVAFLVGFENRLLVLLQWANHYFTRHRGARLITEPPR